MLSTVQSAGRNGSDNSQMEFEAKSARDGAWLGILSLSLNLLNRNFFPAPSEKCWFILDLKCVVIYCCLYARYDVATFISHRSVETSEPVIP